MAIKFNNSVTQDEIIKELLARLEYTAERATASDDYYGTDHNEDRKLINFVKYLRGEPQAMFLTMPEVGLTIWLNRPEAGPGFKLHLIVEVSDNGIFYVQKLEEKLDFPQPTGDKVLLKFPSHEPYMLANSRRKLVNQPMWVPAK